MSRVVILQSNYLPWKGYFDLIHDADVFVFYDEVKYTKNDWRNRNKICSKNGVQWITIPVPKDSVKYKISEVRIVDRFWQAKHFKALCYAYGRAPHFDQIGAFFEEHLLKRSWEYLVDVNRFFIREIATMLGCQTRFLDSKTFGLQGDRVERIVSLLKTLGAGEYISGPAARDYVAGYENLFADAGVRLTFKDYSGYPAYRQLRAPFEHAVSIVDMLANVPLGEIPRLIWGWRGPPSPTR